MSVYRSLLYRDALNRIIQAKKKHDSSFNYQWLADGIRVEKSFMSKVMNGSRHFTSDQLYAACKFLGLNPEESAYLLLLWEVERTGLSERKINLERQIAAIQAEHRTTNKNLKAKPTAEDARERLREYYLNPYYAVVHIYLTIPLYQAAPEQIPKKLGINETQFKNIVAALERMDLIRWDKEQRRYKVLNDHINLDEFSSVYAPNLALSRAMAMSQALRIPKEKRYGYSMTISTDAKTQDFIKEEFMKFLKRIEAAVRASKPDRVCELTFDLFPWDIG